MTTRLLFVCMGNICRSPTAEAVMRHLLAERGLTDVVEVDSAGTGSWHVGSPPDERSCAAAARRGIPLAGAARQVGPADFRTYDLLLAVDDDNLRELRTFAPPGLAHKARRLSASVDVPDPYYGGEDGFDHVLDVITDACERLLDELDLRQG
ncbi:MAG TPA: low molecular weight protein-tyrosine-phosphatase [Mycobacteriales bacterium]|nr:low molecular weight protein-tyrosine-phosphatase [Mycobacteriales bacterium]